MVANKGTYILRGCGMYQRFEKLQFGFWVNQNELLFQSLLLIRIDKK
jgi:hypothetical protein